MNRKIKLILAVLIFIFGVLVGNWPGGSNIRDEWDNLIKWANGKKKVPVKDKKN